MPVYEYFCRTCDDKFEVMQPMTKMVQVMDCPEGHQGAQKVLSVFAMVNTVSSSQSFDSAACCGGAEACGMDSCCSMEA